MLNPAIYEALYQAEGATRATFWADGTIKLSFDGLGCDNYRITKKNISAMRNFLEYDCNFDIAEMDFTPSEALIEVSNSFKDMRDAVGNADVSWYQPYSGEWHTGLFWCADAKLNYQYVKRLD